jgi:UDP-N-acetylglucosamine acyltransferase
MSIHPSAIIEDGAQIGADVIGPFCIVGPKVLAGTGFTYKSHVVVTGDTQIGADTRFFHFAALVRFRGM